LLSIAIGVVVYDETIRRGPLAGPGLVILLTLMGISVIQLARAEHAPASAAADPPAPDRSNR
jgi:hypothetical protein